MQEKISTPPKGCLRLFMRAPVFFARLGFSGWERVFGLTWMLLTTTGRYSGKKRYAMVDVQLYDRNSDTYYIEAGFGHKCDWYRNIQEHPEFEAQVGRRRFRATARLLPPEKAGDIVLEYARQHKAYTWIVLRIVGVNPKQQLRELAEKGVFLAVQPIK